MFNQPRSIEMQITCVEDPPLYGGSRGRSKEVEQDASAGATFKLDKKNN
jgi:hypothetical protein